MTHIVKNEWDLFIQNNAQDKRDAEEQLALMMDKLSIERTQPLAKDTILVLDIPDNKKSAKRQIARPFPMHLQVDRVYIHIDSHKDLYFQYLLTLLH